MGKNHYETLGVSQNASGDEIKKSFRKLSLKHHPDRGGDEEVFKEINLAYETLGDPEKKQQYDFQAQMGLGGMGRGMPFDMNNIAQMFFGGGQRNQRQRMPEDPVFNMLFSGLGGLGAHRGAHGGFHRGAHPNIKIFHNGVAIDPMTGQRIHEETKQGQPSQSHQTNNAKKPEKPKKPKKPKTIQLKAEIKLSDAYHGCILPIDVKRKVVEIGVEREEVEKLYVKVTEGIDHDEIIHLKGKGHINEDVKGDVQLQIKIEPHETFQRRGMDLIFSRQISFKESLVGFNFTVEHLNGKKFSINNTNGRIVLNNQQTELPNLGMKREGISGKLIIRFEVNIPEALTKEQKEKISAILE